MRSFIRHVRLLLIALAAVLMPALLLLPKAFHRSFQEPGFQQCQALPKKKRRSGSHSNHEAALKPCRR